MLLTLALIILGTSILVFFSDEFARIIKKLFSVYWIRLLLPIIIVSMLIEHYMDWVLRGKEFILELVYCINAPLHLETTVIAQIIFLFLIANIPIWILHLLAKRKMIPKPWEHTYLTSILLWVVAVILLIVP